MIISDLEHLKAISELSSIVSGGCSVEYNLVNGVPTATSQGAPLKTTQNSNGSIIYSCQDATSTSSITIGPSSTVVTASVVVS